jgi:predicted O-linked N-acetylglucosamine transferase (SPINDLY family)
MNTATLDPVGVDAPGAAHWNSGLEHAGRSDWLGATQAFAQAVAAAPGDALYWTNLANAWRRLGEFGRAVESAEHALSIDPRQAVAWRVLGDSLAQQHRYAEAVSAFERLEAQGERHADAMAQHAAMLIALKRPLDAVSVLMRAAAEKPDMAALHAIMATAFRDATLPDLAVECLKTALALEPGNLQALATVCYEKRHVFGWDDLDADVAAIERSLRAAPEGVARMASTFSLLSLPLEPALQLAAARGEAAFNSAQAVELPPLTAAECAARAQTASRRPRLGLLSYDFHEHPVSQLIVELLERMHGGRFELWLYSTGPDDGSALRGRIIGAADHFIDLRGSSDREAARRVREDGIDLLIDLQGQTRGQRQGILAHRPAPLQVAFLGYPGSTGASYMDYLIGDPLVTPFELAGLYTEKLAQMPGTFQPNGRWRPLPQPMSRAAAGLPEDAFVMCAFNHTYKILPAAFDAWCAVMREVPNAVLWLKETNGQLRDGAWRQAELRGVARERVLFAPNVGYADHFSRLALADVFADTWPYNAHTTAADALWAGVPVVTLPGESFASRVAMSILAAAGLEGLAMRSVEDYTAALVTMAKDPDVLPGLRSHLTTNRMALPLFDAPAYTRHFEALLQRMWQRWCDGLPPEHLAARELADTHPQPEMRASA